jgi:hypothetical protein
VQAPVFDAAGEAYRKLHPLLVFLGFGLLPCFSSCAHQPPVSALRDRVQDSGIAAAGLWGWNGFSA